MDLRMRSTDVNRDQEHVQWEGEKRRDDKRQKSSATVEPAHESTCPFHQGVC